MPIQGSWSPITFYPNYQVNTEGVIVRLHPVHREMRPYTLPDGSLGVKLSNHEGQKQHLVRRLVAEAFCSRFNHLCDSVIHKDDNKLNVNAENLEWRPRWFAWKYSRQFREPTLEEWHQIAVMNEVTGRVYSNVIEAGIQDGCLWREIWNYANTGDYVFPGMIYSLI